ncbi:MULTISPECIES: Xaa-Pro dipeptidyl-peptidase [Streptomyces]|uniref:Xaa-Pro dipeptidyl-peptidase n=1 Tax=Streptomyces TaxID=1883 RepID=UPI0022492F4E|nr:Xaa-Pro dipeptidyl-peptidase [Streptomyces sp. JHD 1]MCX2971417.1 Xaa-Pro dipeptidyl-peptidase [Streptomyces sp. JHD 1]
MRLRHTRQPTRRRRRAAATALLAALTATLPPLLGAPAHADTDAAQAVQERVYVETGTDTDHDGRPDRVALDIARPAGGGPVPVVFEQSPYRYGTNPAEFHGVDVDHLPQEDIFDGAGHGPSASADGPARTKRMPGLPGWYDDYFLPRGYAVVLGHSIGTGDSTGCPTTGDMNETLGTTAVVDWLNGRATAYDESGRPVQADWSTGDVGMLGVSYNGTLANMAATTGVAGLKAIVPIAAISDWYDYYRANGLVVAPGGYQGEDADVLAEAVVGNSGCADEIDDLTARQDRATGDYTDFWQARDYVRRVSEATPAVLVMHGHSDWNVKGEHYARWWEALRAHDVPRKIWLHRGGHATPSRPDYRETVGRWFDEHVKGLDTGIMDEPTADVQLADGSWHQYADWPDPQAQRAVYHLSADSATAPGTLGAEPTGSQVRQSFTDQGRTRDAASLVARPDGADGARLVYRTPPLETDLRLSGVPEVTLRAAVDNRDAANLTALLVDYGPPGGSADPTVVTRGWIDPHNRDGRATGRPIVRGREYDLTFRMQPKDHLFEEGRRIGLVVISTDRDFTLRPRPGTTLHLAPAGSTLALPLVAGDGDGGEGCDGLEHTVSGSLRGGGSDVQPGGSWFRSGAGAHRACLDGPDGADFDLYLQKWGGAGWSEVARATTSGPDEELSYDGTAGYYRYRVHAYSGSGDYTLGYTTP